MWQKYKTDDTWKSFTTERQKYNSMIKKAKLESWGEKDIRIWE